MQQHRCIIASRASSSVCQLFPSSCPVVCCGVSKSNKPQQLIPRSARTQRKSVPISQNRSDAIVSHEVAAQCSNFTHPHAMCCAQGTGTVNTRNKKQEQVNNCMYTTELYFLIANSVPQYHKMVVYDCGPLLRHQGLTNCNLFVLPRPR